MGDVSLGPDSRVALLAELDIPAVAADLDGNITHWSAAAARLYGRGENEMLGSSLSAVRLSREDEAIARSIVGELLAGGRWQGEFEIADASGAPLRLDARAMVRVDRDNQPVGFEAAFADLSARAEGERRAADCDPRLRLAQRIGGLGDWEWDVRKGRVVSSDMVSSLLGLNAGAELTIADALAAFPPQERLRVESVLEQLRSGELDDVSMEYRLDGADGLPRWMEAHCLASRDRQGVLIRVRGTTLDITARVSADARLREAGEFWQATVDSSAARIATLDQHANIVAVNAAWRRFAQSEGGGSDFVGRNCHSPSNQRWFLCAPPATPARGRSAWS